MEVARHGYRPARQPCCVRKLQGLRFLDIASLTWQDRHSLIAVRMVVVGKNVALRGTP